MKSIFSKPRVKTILILRERNTIRLLITRKIRPLPCLSEAKDIGLWKDCFKKDEWSHTIKELARVRIHIYYSDFNELK